MKKLLLILLAVVPFIANGQGCPATPTQHSRVDSLVARKIRLCGASGIYKFNSLGHFVVATAGTDYATALTIASNGTDANYTAVVNTIKYLPASTLSTARTITMPTGSNGDVIEIYNNESVYAWNLSGDPVYLADRTTVVTQLQYNYPTIIKYIAGKWTILN